MKSGTVGDRFGQWFWCTITAPGSDVLPWDGDACGHAPDVPCSGKLGCRVDRFDSAEWNGLAPRRWSWFMTYVRRRLSPGDDAAVQYCGVWEWQERGVLHRHFLLRVERPTTEKRVAAAVRGAARRWGFGSQYDVSTISGDAARQVWYVAKYASKTADDVDGRPVLNVVTGEIRPCRGFRPWSASRSWGDTMKAVRERQRSFAAGRSPLAGAGGAGGALDPNSDISTVGPVGGAGPPLDVSASVPL